MFTELYELVKAGDKLTLELSKGPDDTMKVVVVPALGKTKVPALSTPMALCATPAELDAGFHTALMSYQTPRAELTKQVELTAALMSQAKATQAAQAVKALENKPAKPGAKVVASASEEHDDDDVAGEDDQAETSRESSQNTADEQNLTKAPEASGQTNLADLFDN